MSSLSEKFTFINVSGPNQGKDENLRKVVRSNAMIKYRQKEKQKAIKQHRRETVQKTVAEDSLATPPASEPWGPMGPSDNWPHNTCNDWPPEWKKALSETQTMVQPSVQPLEDRRARKSVTFTALSVSMFEKSLVSSPRSIFGGGVDEPFDAYPIGGFSRYNSYVLHHFITVMARSCLPIDHGNGPNPLTKIWVPYAMTDPVIFLATLKFAAVHLDILQGQYTSPKTLMNKGETIRLINAKLQSSTEALTDTTIGAVVMLAGMESMNGSCADLQIHMEALAKMVELRGGLQQLGWGGVLHMFISWQDLLPSAMMASAPHFPPNPCGLLNGGDTIGHDICGAMTEVFHNLRYLTACLTDWGRSVDNHDLASFIKQRSTLEHRLFSLTIRKADMKHCDYHFEGRRLGALIYLQCVLRNFKPFCAALRNLKAQLVEVILEAEEQCGTIGDPRLYRGSLAWVWFMGGILALNRDEENFFPTRIVNSTKVWMLEGSKTWADMEVMLREIAWDDNLLTAECSSLWSRVGEIWGKNVGGIEVSSRSVHRCLSGGSGL